MRAWEEEIDDGLTEEEIEQLDDDARFGAQQHGALHAVLRVERGDEVAVGFRRERPALLYLAGGKAVFASAPRASSS